MSKSKIFSTTPMVKPKRNTFDLGHEVKMSGKMGKLLPIMVIDTVPGDVFRNTSQVMLRFAPMLAPIMHRVDVTTHFFFVPNRIIWDEWEDFITGGPDGEAAPVSPYFTAEQVYNLGISPEYCAQSSLWDYMGLPIADLAGNIWNGSTQRISSLPFRAYQRIYEDYYIDQNLGYETEYEYTSGQETNGQAIELLTLKNRAWEKDYFTSALPWPQRGADVLIPIEGAANFTYKDTSEVFNSSGFSEGDLQTDSGAAGVLKASAAGGGLVDARIENIEDIDFQNTTITINDLRRSVRLQEWLENNARGGGRYTEQIMSHFGIRVPDYRLQRPEYLGGGKQPVVISEVLAQSAAESTPIGDMYGHGLSVGRSNQFSYQCLEHGWIIGLITIMPRTAYSQGIPRMFSRTNKFDYFFREFANIGEQEIKNKELFFTATDGTDPNEDDGTFGYTPRYAEYKFQNDRIAGDMRTTLEFWHLGREFGSLPTLSQEFIEMRAFEGGFNRIFAVTTDVDNMWMQIYHDLKAYRPMPYYGVPTI